ncbi:hypothetical protein [Roseateles sp.]|uniref:hypothetical protein n=1 Tax=Roseateles sp. TaxID=1971397 RepID=UPI00286A19F0|nr:hypothetical protein [Roseateles sp.]
MFYAIKTELHDLAAPLLKFNEQKTMYGGKHIAAGDRIFVFASEPSCGTGLVAHGIVSAAVACPRMPCLGRQTPRVSITVQPRAFALRRLGRSELKQFTDWQDGRPETELNFKFYRQATHKIVGISALAGAFLLRFFEENSG